MARQKTDPLHVVVYPSNFNDDNGHKMLYVSSNAREEVGLDKLDDFCHEYENLPKGYVNLCFEVPRFSSIFNACFCCLTNDCSLRRF